MVHVVFFLLGTILLNVSAQLLLKFGVGRPGLGGVFPLSAINPYTAGGALCFVLALGFYIGLLQRVPLMLAQAFMSLQFAAIMLAAWIVLGERLSATQWIGAGLIALGLIFVAR